MEAATYEQRRGKIEEYFDRTAVKAWEQLTSTAPVGRIRRTVRAGRDRMRSTLMGYLPQDLRGARVLDAGCGTGALAMDAARRGAHVVAIDLSPSLVDVARRRVAEQLALNPVAGSIEFLSGDMLDPQLGGPCPSGLRPPASSTWAAWPLCDAMPATAWSCGWTLAVASCCRS